MHLEGAWILSFLSVYVGLEVDKELFQRVDRVATRHIIDVKGCLENGRDITFVLDLFNAFSNHLSDF